MAGVFLGKPFAQEHMPQVTFTVGTDDFCPPSVCISFPYNGSFNLIIKTGPTTVAVKFILTFVQGSIAALTCIHAGLVVIHIFPCPRPFSTFFKDNKLFKIS